jgi:Ethylene-responsive protein kinase Le-CTR1
MIFRLADSRWYRWLLLALMAALPPAAGADTLVAPGAATTWRYLDSGPAPPADWTKPAFDDGNWQSGAAPLGYGDSGLSSQVSFGDDPKAKRITTYFRHEFKAPEVSGTDRLVILMRIDDGAIVYLNGQELVRENIALGATDSSTTAQRRIENDEERLWRRFSSKPAALVPGKNSLAVELHQFNAASSDLYFDLALESYGPAARDATLTFWKSHLVPAGAAIPDGYADGGRQSTIDDEGNIRSGREVIVVDRKRDPELAEHLLFARSPLLARLPPVARARMLALYVDIQTTPPAGRNDSLAAVERLMAEYRGTELLLGRSLRAGVCRHRALLFKVLADDAGLDVALVRGNLDSASGPHVWNELDLPGGQKRLVDCMNPAAGFDLPPTTASIANRYRTVNNEPYYPLASQAK